MKIEQYLRRKRAAIGLTATEEKIYFCLASVDPSLCLRSGSVPIDGASTEEERTHNGPTTEEGV
jgi:hypothetical protein